MEKKMIKHILVPTDGSDCSIKAASYAGDLARLSNAQVTILLVQDERSVIASAWNATAGQNGPVEEARSKIERAAKDNEIAVTREALGETPAGVELIHEWGHPSEQICRFVQEKNIDLIVMGSHGRSGLKKMLLGSVSHSVVNEAKCAVTIVR